MRSIVVDASAVVDLLLDNEKGLAVSRHMEESGSVSVAHLDAEVFSALGRLHRSGALAAPAVADRLALLGRLPIQRLPITTELTLEAWRLRENVALRDGLYVAAARAVGCRVLTTDLRFQKAAPDHTLDPA